MKLIVLVLTVLLAGCSGAAAPSPDTQTESPHVVGRTVETGTMNLSGLPERATTPTRELVSAGDPIEQTFRFQRGPSAPSNWNFPISVEFQRVVSGNWTETHAFGVDESELFSVELLAEEQYRIVVEDTGGDRRVMGIYVPKKPDADRTVLIGPCCIDDFS